METNSAGSIPPLIYTKVRLPRLSNLLSRPRLLDWLHENIHRKLLLVCAGPGYGKTPLLVDFGRSADLPVCWYTLDPSDRDPYTFLDYLVEAIRVRFPSFGRRTREVLRGGGRPAGLREAIGFLVNELSEDIADYMAIVLDDYHTVEEQEEVNRCLDTLLAYLPEHVHLILASRSIPPLSLARLAAYGEAEAIGREDLRFTVEEAAAVLRQSLKVDLPEAAVRQLVEDSEGWITGILLQVQAGRREVREFLSGLPRSPDRVYTYLAEEVLRHLDPEERRFLCGAAIPRQVDAPFCDALLERQDSARLLSSLERRNLFLIPLEGGWYRFHALFREFLLQEARADGEGYGRLQRRAAQIWRERGEREEAVEHLLQAQAWEEAAEEIETLARALYERSRFPTLIRWVEALPPDLLDRWPRLLLFLGKAGLQAGQEDKAWTALQRAERLFAERGDRERWVQVQADRATLERMQGKYREALETARRALSAWSGETLPALVDLHRTAGICLLALGDPAGAEEHVRAAVACGPAAGPYNQALAHLDLGYCLRAQGRMEEADAAYRQALEHARAVGSPELEASILNNLAMGPFLRGELFPALELLEQAREAARTSLSPRLQAGIQASLGDLYRDLGERARARQMYQEGLEQARRAHSAEWTAYLQEALGNLSRQEGLLPEARRLLEEALNLAASPRERARIEVSLALLEAAEGRPEEALRRLEGAIRRQEEARWQPDLLRSLLAQALVWHRHGRPELAQEALQKALEMARTLRVVEPFLAEGEELRPLGERLPAGEEWVSPIREALQRTAGRPSLPPREQTLPLRILALGPGRVFRGEEEIPAGAWGYRQAREIFFYLFFNAPVSRGEVGLAFWPERSAGRVSSAFHVALFQARRAVGCFFAIFRDEKYHWNPEVPYWCDVLEFERLLDQAAQVPDDDPRAIPLLEQALALYDGDFLEDMDREWCFLRREELGRRRMQALLRLGRLYLGRGKAEPARRTFLQALQVDGYNEEAYRGLMRSQVLAGDRIAALRTYRRCRRLLRQELGIEPSEETRALYQALREGKQLP